VKSYTSSMHNSCFQAAEYHHILGSTAVLKEGGWVVLAGWLHIKWYASSKIHHSTNQAWCSI